MSTATPWAGLQLRQLLALVAIVHHGSFHKAAAHLDYTQSGISQQIAALERTVGEKLIVRPGGSRPVRLTKVGEIVFEHAATLLDQVNAAQADVEAIRDGSRGLLRVGVYQSVGARILPALMRRLVRDLPSLRIDVTQTTTDLELFALMKAGQLDITFAILPIPKGPYAAIELFADPLVIMAAVDSPFVRRNGRATLHDLVDIRLIVGSERPEIGGLEAHMRQQGLTPNVILRSDDSVTVQGLVAAGAGIACVPRLMADVANTDVAIIELDESVPPRRVGLSWREDRRLPHAREVFRDIVARTCTALQLGHRPSRAISPKFVDQRPSPTPTPQSQLSRDTSAMSCSNV